MFYFITNELNGKKRSFFVRDAILSLSWDLILHKMKVCLRNLFRKKHSIINDLDMPLSRCLNLFDLILLSVSGMIGSGIYVLRGVVAKDLTGPAIIIVTLLAGFSCLFGQKNRDLRKRKRKFFFCFLSIEHKFRKI
jgi:hypothetical protein